MYEHITGILAISPSLTINWHFFQPHTHALQYLPGLVLIYA